MTGTAGVTAHGAARQLDAAEVRRRLEGCEIVVPASSANLGPGFDTLAVALQLYLRVRVCAVLDDNDGRLQFDLCGTALTGDNYIERAFRDLLGPREFPSIALEVRTDIPMRGGLGSSAAATVAGLLLADRLIGGHSRADLLTRAARLDGHADNVAAALLGGLTISCVADEGRVIARAVRWPEHIGFVVASPAAHLGTPESRSVLPDTVSRADAVFNLQRALLLVHAIEHGNLDDLREALRDRWHQPFRAPLVPGFAEVLALAHPRLLGACLSGSGPSVLVLCSGATAEVAELVSAAYVRSNIPCCVRTLDAHQPGSQS